MKIINDQTKQKFTTISLIFLLFLVNQIYGQGWQTTMPDENEECFLNSGVASSIDGGYLLVNDFTDETYEERAIKVNKIDADGDILWSKTIARNRDLFVRDIKACSDGGFIIVGKIDGLTGGTDGYVCKIDAAGNLLWETLLDDTGSMRFAERVTEAVDSGYVVLGDQQLTKLDYQGIEIWTISFTFPTNLYVEDLVANSDSSIAILANANTGDRLLKFDYFGNLIWEKTFVNTLGATYDYLGSIDKTNNGYILGGYVRLQN